MKVFNNVIQTPDGVSRILLYGDVGEGCRVDSARVVAELMSIEAASSRIEVHINSRGGDVFHGMAIYNALAASKADITLYIDGIAASIAAVIALCGKPLYMARHAKLMLHAVSGGTYGTADELRQTAEMIEGLERDLADMIAKRCNDTADNVAAKYFRDGADHWFSATEAEQLKLIDGIIDGPAVPPSDQEEEIYQFINQYNNTRMALSDEIKKMPAFSGMSDEDIVAHLQRQANDATNMEALKKANEALKKRVADLEAKEVAALLDAAVTDGRITTEQKGVYVNLMNADRESAEALLASLPKKAALRVDNFIAEGKKTPGINDMTWDELDRCNMLATLKAEDPATFAAKYKEKFGVDFKD